jgi:glycosyltransferase involved in cell wall biosynthesis
LKPEGRTSAGRRIVMLLSNPATFDQRPLKEAHALARAGWRVTILAWDRELETKSDSVFDDGLVIKRMRVAAGHGTPFLTVPKLVLFYFWCIVRLLTSPGDAIHCHDVDTLPAGYAARAFRLGRARLVYDMHDLPEAFLRFFPLSRVTQAVALSTARSASDAVLVVNDRFVTYLGRLGFQSSKLVVVMNAPPVSEGRGSKRRGEGLGVLYYGLLSEERGVGLLLEAVKGVAGVTLTLAGRGELEGVVRQRAASGVAVKFLGWLKMQQLNPEIRKADIIPSLYEPKTKNAQMATPGKLLTAMSLSIPTLVPSGSFQAEIVRKYRCGLVVDWRSVEEVRSAIRSLLEDRELYDNLATAAYSAFVSSFSWEVMEARLIELYGRLIPLS